MDSFLPTDQVSTETGQVHPSRIAGVADPLSVATVRDHRLCATIFQTTQRLPGPAAALPAPNETFSTFIAVRINCVLDTDWLSATTMTPIPKNAMTTTVHTERRWQFLHQPAQDQR